MPRQCVFMIRIPGEIDDLFRVVGEVVKLFFGTVISTVVGRLNRGQFSFRESGSQFDNGGELIAILGLAESVVGQEIPDFRANGNEGVESIAQG